MVFKKVSFDILLFYFPAVGVHNGGVVPAEQKHCVFPLTIKHGEPLHGLFTGQLVATTAPVVVAENKEYMSC